MCVRKKNTNKYWKVQKPHGNFRVLMEEVDYG